LLQSRIEEAIIWLEKAHIGNPGSPWPHAWLASAYGLKGDMDRAAAELAEARRLLGGRAYSSIAAMRASNWGVPAIRELHEVTFFAGLRKAGVPEELPPRRLGMTTSEPYLTGDQSGGVVRSRPVSRSSHSPNRQFR
jgi:hypothetical protein